ncbi:hypothetical protein QBC38DRAFT_475022 [Podospora fimiseda]|uniref:Uncharacterized protein n=1 Tax=Podospora fimiseda TaxID=252190 RepID=A0AAN7H3W7_9PEZI|nr:hypothetical protein QBC38DRAFT_475022 [Podospora fimiseda]
MVHLLVFLPGSFPEMFAAVSRIHRMQATTRKNARIGEQTSWMRITDDGLEIKSPPPFPWRVCQNRHLHFLHTYIHNTRVSVYRKSDEQWRCCCRVIFESSRRSAGGMCGAMRDVQINIQWDKTLCPRFRCCCPLGELS